jgi:hypothetical protein
MSRIRLALSLIFGASAALSSAQITISNVEAGEVVRHPVVALRGTADSNSIAIGATWETAIRFPVHEGQWSAFVELQPGENMVRLHSGRTTVKYRIDYQPMTTKKKVMTMFVQASDEDGRYFSTRPNERFQIREKMDVAMKLLQSATAEAMAEAGYGPKTFDLEFDQDGKVVVHFVTLPKTGDEMRAMEGVASWGYIYGQLKEKFPEEDARWCGVLGFTGYDIPNRRALGHYALGGGALALFGGGTMSWWPNTLKEVPVALADATVVDPAVTFEDSNGRETVWAQVSTGYGAMLHELGHTFGLPHSADRFSVMSRGFDYFSRLFKPIESRSKRNPTPTAFKQDERMRWCPYFAARLNVNPFFQPDGVGEVVGGGPSIKFEGEFALIEAPAGIAVWGADRDDVPASFEVMPEDQPTSLRISRAEMRQKLNTKEPFRITVLDRFGRQVTIEDKEQ